MQKCTSLKVRILLDVTYMYKRIPLYGLPEMLNSVTLSTMLILAFSFNWFFISLVPLFMRFGSCFPPSVAARGLGTQWSCKVENLKRLCQALFRRRCSEIYVLNDSINQKLAKHTVQMHLHKIAIMRLPKWRGENSGKDDIAGCGSDNYRAELPLLVTLKP